MNKYERTPEIIIDLHGHTACDAKKELDKILSENYSHVRIITGKCSFRERGPVLGPFVRKYLEERNIKFNPAKMRDGGEGALEIFLGEK